MRLSARLLEVEKDYALKEVDDLYNRNELLEENHFNLNHPDIDFFNCKELSGSGIILLDAQMSFSSTITDLFQIEGDCILMEFMFNNKKNVEAEISQLDWIKPYEANTHNIIYSSNFKGRFKMSPHEPVCFLLILLSKDFYFQLIPENSKLHTEFSKNIFKQNTCALYDTHLPFNPAIHNIIQDIRNCHREGELKKLFIETKIQELLIAQLEMYKQEHLLKTQTGLNDEDFLKLKEVKKILDKEFKTAPTLGELSKRTYLNEFKLKKGFKACYGTTIRSYIIILKMKYAIALLNENKYNISEIAHLCGYNGLVQFSAAFKTFYGCSPSDTLNGNTCRNKISDINHNYPLCSKVKAE